MYYPKELEFTETEEHFMLKQMQYEPPQQEVKDIMDYLDIQDYSIGDFKDMGHLRRVIMNLINDDVHVAITDVITFEEQKDLERKIEKRKQYRNKQEKKDTCSCGAVGTRRMFNADTDICSKCGTEMELK